jgi:hypothetical protein
MISITPAEMIEWFRAKAVEFNNMANTLEETFYANGQPRVNPVDTAFKPSTFEVSVPLPILNVHNVKPVVVELGVSRYTRLAEELSKRLKQTITVEELKKFIGGNPNDFAMKGRGWITAKT